MAVVEYRQRQMVHVQSVHFDESDGTVPLHVAYSPRPQFCVLFNLTIVQPDLIILGVGERMTARLDPALVEHLGSKGIRVEQMDTVSA